MNLLFKSLSLLTLSLCSITAFAAPVYLTTHNNTTEESNAYISGTIPSPYPTLANSTRRVYWNLVRLACHGHTVNNKCIALIQMATDTDNPIRVGIVEIDTVSGEITPNTLSNNGYTLTVDGPAEASISRN